MNMNFNRLKCQLFIESELGCSDPANFGLFTEEFKAYKVEGSNVSRLSDACVADAQNFFYKSSISFLEATYGIVNKHSSWAIVKLYYSLFYSLRAYFLLNKCAIIKNGKGGLYLLKAESNERPEKINEKGDYKSTIKAFKKTFTEHIINTNMVDGENVFDWIMSYRELVSYRIDTFLEPESGYDVIPSIPNDSNEYDILMSKYINDEYLIYCFDKNHSIYATPLYFIHDCSNIFREHGIENPLTVEQLTVIRNILRKLNLDNSVILREIFQLL